MKKIIVVFLIVLSISCKKESYINKLDAGTYRASLKVSDSIHLPFLFEVVSENQLNIFNAAEVIRVDEITYKNDSVYIKTPVFEGFIVAKIENGKLLGSFVKSNLNRRMPFEAMKKNTRFDIISEPTYDISGHWETVFSPKNNEESYVAKGIFRQLGNKVTGTFRTTMGDYRYLEGVINGEDLKLSTFDGAHAFLFTAKVKDSSMIGRFYSGNHFKESFIAKRNELFQLPKADSLTFLNEGYNKVDFSFPDASGNTVSMADERFKNKVVLIQIMGTWCPNCLDETKFYANYYKKNKVKDLEIIALAFEYVKTEKAAFENINRLKDQVGIDYPVLLAQYGSSSKIKAQEKLPMLNHVLSYPTTIFIDKEGVVRKIHTGFNGPATRNIFTEFKAEFHTFVTELLKE